MWTFTRKIVAGFAMSFILLVVIGATAYRGVEALTKSSYSVTHTHDVLDAIAAIANHIKDAETGQRGFIITGDDVFLEPYNAAIEKIPDTITTLRELTVDNPVQQERIDELDRLAVAKTVEMKKRLDQRTREGFVPVSEAIAAGEGRRLMDDLRRVLEQLDREERRLLGDRADEVEAVAAGTRTTVLVATILCAVLVLFAGVSITRSVTTQVGSAVRQVESSSAELQAAANQQVTGSKEQVAAITEITTTINELLATSRQIAEGAQRVAQVASETARSATAGDGTVDSAHESINAIRRQVDQVVNHMLELGKKSQQIGSVLDIVSELAEQTNILAINATIEAAGAGDAGRRFAVVADEIRKLADRVGDSTKEIRTLIDDVRAAVNTTVMATEGGSKAVDAGTRQFDEVASSFKRITDLVGTTTEASREIELSTKQQATAVEQVKIAIANVAQASRETETSSAQTLQTAAQLTTLSRDLLRIIEPNAA
ncbi:MAG TPA: methyl-accepting chemotaxis protein [Nannocystaceae bacterium]|nr:methyl-accepting chemotaxis protein [Nannocystaceae bacterium]